MLIGVFDCTGADQVGHPERHQCHSQGHRRLPYPGNLEALDFELSKDEFEVSCSFLCEPLCSFMLWLGLSCRGALAAWIPLLSAAPFHLHVCGMYHAMAAA